MTKIIQKNIKEKQQKEEEKKKIHFTQKKIYKFKSYLQVYRMTKKRERNSKFFKIDKKFFVKNVFLLKVLKFFTGF